MSRELYRAYLWHKAHSGHCSPPGAAVCALDHARAELWAEEEEDNGELRFLWEEDPFADMSGIEEAEEVLICCCQVKDGERWRTVASCGGIADPGRDYSRTMQAELAAEALWYEAEAAGLVARQL